MLIWLRFAFAVAAFLTRLKLKGKTGVPNETLDTVPLWTHERRHKGRLLGTTIGTPVRTSLHFSLHPERWTDRTLKFFGLASELDTQDSEFNRRVFIASDHPLFADRIVGNPLLQRLTLDLFGLGFTQIHANGTHLSARIQGSTPLSGPQKLAFAQLAKALLPKLTTVQATSGMDPFLKKALLVEAVTWAIATYGIVSMVEWVVNLESPRYPQYLELLKTSMVLAVFGIVAYLWFLKSAFRRSTRMRGVLRETGFIAIFAFPLAAVPLVSDINIELDRSHAVQIHAGIVRKELRISRSRRGRESRSYYLHFGQIVPAARSGFLSPTLRVSPADYGRATEGGQVTIHLRSGRLRIPWVSQLEFKTSVE